MNFKKKIKPKYCVKNVFKSLYALFEGREKVLDAFKSKIFVKNEIESKKFLTKYFSDQVITPKQMLHRLPVELTQIKTGNTSEKLSNEIRQSIYSLY